MSRPPNRFRGVVAVLARVVCYGALAGLVAAVATLALLSGSGACSQLGEGAVACSSTTTQVVAETAMSVVLVTVNTGFALILPLVGLVLLVADIRRWRRA